MNPIPHAARVQEAREILRDVLPPTRLVPAAAASKRSGRQIWLKLESELPTGSFKVRGALYALTRRHDQGEVAEVVASSTGNHGAAVAWAAERLGVPATIFVPERHNPVKRARIEERGGRVVAIGPDLAAAFQAASDHARRTGAYFLNDATDPDVPAGTGTIALELLEQLPELVRVIVPAGDTALIRGIASVVRARHPGATVVGVQAERAPAYALSWRSGRPTPTDTCDTIADGLATRTPEAANVEAIRALVDDFVLVSEDELLDGVRGLLLDEHIVAEPAGAAAYVAIRKCDPMDGATVALVSGSNLSDEVLRMAARRPPPTPGGDPHGGDAGRAGNRPRVEEGSR